MTCLGQLGPAKDGEDKSCNCHQAARSVHPGARAMCRVADGDALVRQVIQLLDEEEEGLGVLLDEVVAGEVAVLHELVRDRFLAGNFFDATEEDQRETQTEAK